MECDCHVISKGICIPKAMEVHSDQGFGCDFRCDWERSMGTWSGVISTGQHSLWSPRRGQWSKPMGGEGKVSK